MLVFPFCYRGSIAMIDCLQPFIERFNHLGKVSIKQSVVAGIVGRPRYTSRSRAAAHQLGT